MKKIKFTKKDIEDIKILYSEKKLSSSEIGKKYGCSGVTLRKLLKKENIPIRGTGQKYKGGKKESDRRYYNANKKGILERYKSYSLKNKKKLSEYHRNWRNENKEVVREKKRRYEKEKKNNDPVYRLTSVFKNALTASIKEKNICKTSKTFDILGYTKEELIEHLTKLFEPNMSMENYGEWHIDHIIPISKFNYSSVNDNDFKECWSLSNLQPAWAFDNLTKNNRFVAHQYKIREKKKQEEIENIDFNFEKAALENSEVKEITRNECEKIIKEYEWLGYLPKYTKYHFGIFFLIDGKSYLGGVVAYQPEYGDNIGVWDKYGYTGKIIQLSRGVCLWWTPKNSASFLISRTNQWIKKNTNYKIVTATVDSSAGEIGIIYQSLNWKYIGTMEGNLLKSGKERIRYGYIINKKIYNQRHIRKMIGTAKREEVLKKFPDVRIINMGRKKRYFAFLGSRTENKKYLKSISNFLKPYPKR